MTLYARIAGGVVAEVTDLPADPSELFHPDLVWRPAPVGCAVGWLVVGDQLQAPAADVGALRTAKLDAIDGAAAARVAAGLVWNGSTVQIDDASRQNIAGISQRAGFVVLEVPGVVWPPDMEWIMADNSRVPVTAAQFLDLAQHVADLYTGIIFVRRTLKDQAEAAVTAEALAAIDPAAGWPA